MRRWSQLTRLMPSNRSMAWSARKPVLLQLARGDPAAVRTHTAFGSTRPIVAWYSQIDQAPVYACVQHPVAATSTRRPRSSPRGERLGVVSPSSTLPPGNSTARQNADGRRCVMGNDRRAR
jgi:hypothetical protein